MSKCITFYSRDPGVFVMIVLFGVVVHDRNLHQKYPNQIRHELYPMTIMQYDGYSKYGILLVQVVGGEHGEYAPTFVPSHTVLPTVYVRDCVQSLYTYSLRILGCSVGST